MYFPDDLGLAKDDPSLEKSNSVIYDYVRWRNIPLKISHVFLTALKEASHIDFVHEKRHMDVGGRGIGACDVSR